MPESGMEPAQITTSTTNKDGFIVSKTQMIGHMKTWNVDMLMAQQSRIPIARSLANFSTVNC